jgi:hypothetical protein
MELNQGGWCVAGLEVELSAGRRKRPAGRECYQLQKKFLPQLFAAKGWVARQSRTQKIGLFGHYNPPSLPPTSDFGAASRSYGATGGLEGRFAVAEKGRFFVSPEIVFLGVRKCIVLYAFSMARKCLVVRRIGSYSPLQRGYSQNRVKQTVCYRMEGPL